MLDVIRDLVGQLRWSDLLDILFVTTLVVWLYSWVRGTRAFRVALGLGLVIFVYLMARAWNLFLTEAVLENIVQVLFIFVIIIFAPEIRQVLERLNPMRVWPRPGEEPEQAWVTEVREALEYLSARSIGALFVIEGVDRLDALVRRGVPVDGTLQRDVLISLFLPTAPTHDGAAWIRDGRILEIGVFLPISEADLSPAYGARHRAALGISEQSDAVVLVVSEERGSVSLVQRGSIRQLADPEELAERLKAGLTPSPAPELPGFRELLLHRWKLKLCALAVVSVGWLSVALSQQTEQSRLRPIEAFNLSPGYEATFTPPEAAVWLRGSRMALAGLERDSVKILLDLGGASVTTAAASIDPRLIITPPGIGVSHVEPQTVAVEIRPRAGPPAP